MNNGHGGTFKVLYPVESIQGQAGSVQLSLNCEVYAYAVFFASCLEKDEYGNLQNYVVDTDPTTTLNFNAISSYADTPEKDINGFVGTRGPQTLLRNLFRAAVIEVTSGKTVDSMLYSGRAAYSDAVRNEFARQLAAIDCGVEVDNVTLEQVFPPLKTKSAFDEVAAASNTVDSLRSKAEQYAVQAGNEALAMQTELISSATTYKEMVVSEVKAESIYFQKIYEQYRNDPETVLMTLYTSTLADVLQKQQGKYILGSSGTGSKQVRLLLNHEQKKQQTPAGDAAEEK